MTARRADLLLLTMRYVNERQGRQEIGPGTARTYRTTLRAFALSPIIPADPSRLTRRHIERWIESRRDRSPGTVRCQLSMVRQFCTWLVVAGYRKVDPSLGVRGPKKPQYLPRGLKRSGVAATFDSCPDARAVLVVSLEVQEGLRACEVAGLEVGDVDLDGRLVQVRMSKGGGQRVLPISEETVTALERYLAEHPAVAGPLVRSYNHPTRGITAHYVSRLVSGWMHEAGLDATGHALRHTMATDSLRRGAHIRDVQRALGHRSITATEVYLPWLVGDLRDAMGGRSYRTPEPPETHEPPGQVPA